MFFFETNILVLLLGLFTINFIAILLIRSEERFWLPSTLIWVLLIASFFVFLTINKNLLIGQELDLSTQPAFEAEDQEVALSDLENTRMQNAAKTLHFLRLVGFQTIICLTGQLLGYRLTSKKQFKKGISTFLVLTIIYLLYEIVRLLK